MKRVVLLATLFLTACGSFGFVQPHTLSLAYKAGDTYRYKFHSSTRQTVVMSGQTLPTQIDITANESAKVNSVDRSGTADLSITFSDFTLKSVAAGITNTTTGLPASTIEVKISTDGTITSIDGNQTTTPNLLAGFSGLGGGFFVTAVLPDHPVKPGDKWSKTYDQANPSGTGGLHVVSDSTYLRDETVNNISTAVVETKSHGTINLNENNPTGGGPIGFSVKGTFTIDVTTWVDPNGHRVVKSHSSGHDDGTIDFPSGFSSGTVQTPPLLQGPITASGDSTTDLSPA